MSQLAYGHVVCSLIKRPRQERWTRRTCCYVEGANSGLTSSTGLACSGFGLFLDPGAMCVLRNGTDEQHWTEWRVLVGGIERGGGWVKGFWRSLGLVRKSSYDSSKPSFPEVTKSTCYWTDEDQKSVYAMLPKISPCHLSIRRYFKPDPMSTTFENNTTLVISQRRSAENIKMLQNSTPCFGALGRNSKLTHQSSGSGVAVAGLSGENEMRVNERTM
ncbi:hypothetical protein J6590_074789 [Homalodisca vitripennis]|nr:hypothetical protein J6590_074789 [Homalodisca vitripennis]